MKREVSYQWRLREVMAAHGMFTVTELVPLLHDRSIDLSASQVHRLASGTPERLSLPVLAALCDIFSCTPAELIATKAQDAPRARPPPATGWSTSTRGGRNARGCGPGNETARQARHAGPARAAAASVRLRRGALARGLDLLRRATRTRWRPTGRAPDAAPTG